MFGLFKKSEKEKLSELLVRKIKQTNQPVFYIYDDGMLEKKIVIE